MSPPTNTPKRKADLPDAYGFHSVSLAIETLRRGKKDQRWFNAARFLMERAAPDVQLMLEAQRVVLEHDRNQQAQNASFGSKFESFITELGIVIGNSFSMFKHRWLSRALQFIFLFALFYGGLTLTSLWLDLPGICNLSVSESL